MTKQSVTFFRLTVATAFTVAAAPLCAAATPSTTWRPITLVARFPDSLGTICRKASRSSLVGEMDFDLALAMTDDARVAWLSSPMVPEFCSLCFKPLRFVRLLPPHRGHHLLTAKQSLCRAFPGCHAARTCIQKCPAA